MFPVDLVNFIAKFFNIPLGEIELSKVFLLFICWFIVIAGGSVVEKTIE